MVSTAVSPKTGNDEYSYYTFRSNVHRKPGWQRLRFSWVGTMR
jgi:hypothetical protein